jgi:O-antigen/teichoic acid export membrane protein
MKILIQLITRVKNSEFLKNVATLTTGTTLAQIISIFTAPILYRIYSKVDYGTLALYLAIISVIGVFSTMQYLQPILLEKDDDEAKKVIWLNMVINVGVTIFVFLLVLTIGKHTGKWLNNDNIQQWLYIAPLSVFFLGQNQIFRMWATRKKKFKIMSFNTILTALLVPAISISFGIFNNGPLGLFLGLLTSQVVPPIVLLISLTKDENMGLKYFSWNDISQKAKLHSNFPVYSLPSAFINRLTNQLPVFFLSTYSGPAVVGIYNLCVKMLGLPIQLIGAAIGDVFRQKATQDYNTIGNCRPIFVKTFKTLTLISILPTIIILFYGPNLFSWIFGPKWAESGVFAQILITVYVGKLIVSPLSYLFYIARKQREELIISILFLITNAVIFIGAKVLTVYALLTFFSINYVVFYIYTIIRSYIFSKKTIQI